MPMTTPEERMRRWLSSAPAYSPVVGAASGPNPGVGGTPQRQFPASAAAWAAAFPAIATPSNLWTFQESASPILDKIGTDNLIENQALLYRQAGDSEPTLSPRFSLEMDTTSSNEWTGPAALALADIAALSSWSFYIRWRMPDNATTGRAVVNKGSVSPRWALLVQSGGSLRWTILDGTNTYTPTTSNLYDDGNYHDTLMVYDQPNGQFRLITELESVSQASTAFLGATVLTVLHFGSGGGLSTLVGTRISYAAFWPSTALTSANLTTIRTPQ